MNSFRLHIDMRKLSALSLLLTALLTCHGVAQAQVTGERTAETTNTLCLEKQRRLTDLEREGASKQLEIRSAEGVLAKARRSPDRKAVEARISNLSQQAQGLTEAISLLKSDLEDEDLSNEERAEITAVLQKKQEEQSQVNQEVKGWEDVLNDNPKKTSDAVATGQGAMATKTLESKLAALKEQQTDLNAKISLERESLTLLKCDPQTVEELAAKRSDSRTGDFSQKKAAAPKVGPGPVNANAATQPIPRQSGPATVATPVRPSSNNPAATQPIPRQSGPATVATPVSPNNPTATQPIPRQPGAATVATPRPVTPKPTVETPIPDRVTVATPKPGETPIKSGQSGVVTSTLAGALVVALTVEQLHACYQRQASPIDCALTVAGSLAAGAVITVLSPTGAVVLTGVKGAFDIKDGIAELNRDWEDWKQRQDQERSREGQLERNRRDRMLFQERTAALQGKLTQLMRDKAALQSIHDIADRQEETARRSLEQLRDFQQRLVGEIKNLESSLTKENANAKTIKANIESAAAIAEQRERDVRKLLDQAIDLGKQANCTATNRDSAREKYKQALNAVGELGRKEKEVQKSHFAMKALSTNIARLQIELRSKLQSGGGYLDSAIDVMRTSADGIDEKAASTLSLRLAQGIPNLRVEITMLRGAYQLPDESVPDDFRRELNELESKLNLANVDPGLANDISRRRAASLAISAEASKLGTSFQQVREPLQNANFEVQIPDEEISRTGGVVTALGFEVADAGNKIADCISQPSTQTTGNVATAAAGVITAPADPLDDLPEDKPANNSNRDTQPAPGRDPLDELPEDKPANNTNRSRQPAASRDPLAELPADRSANTNTTKPSPPVITEVAACDVSGRWKGDYGIVRNYTQSGNTVSATTDYFFGWGTRHEVLTGTLKGTGSGISFEFTIDFTEHDGSKGKGHYVVSVGCGADGKATSFGKQTRVQ